MCGEVMKTRKYLAERMVCKNEKYIIGYKKGELVVRYSKTKEIVKRHRLHSFFKSIVILERLLRMGPRTAVFVSNEELIFSDHGWIYRYNVEQDELNKEHCFSKGMNNPLQFCKAEIKGEKCCKIIYGEYIWNTEKGPVGIWERNEEGSWSEIYQFPANTITHIHNIIYNKYNDRFIILTGDNDSESAIWQADRNFSNVTKVIGGEQTYRACVAFPTETGLFYATDTPLESNKLMHLDRKNNVIKVNDIPGPVIYGRIVNGCLFFATSVEGNPTLGKWKYRLSNKLGPGVKDRNVHIFKCNQDGDLQEVMNLKKDLYPMWLFQFGNALFPNSEDDNIYICPQSCREKGTYIIEL